MQVIVIAMNEGYPGAYRAGRFFPNGQDVVLEVLDQDADPPEVHDASLGRKVPDPRRIGRRSLEAIKRDLRLKLLADGATQAVLSKEAFDQAKRAAETAAGELAGAKIEIARLTEENVALREQVAELQKAAAAGEAAETTEPPSGRGGGGKRR